MPRVLLRLAIVFTPRANSVPVMAHGVSLSCICLCGIEFLEPHISTSSMMSATESLLWLIGGVRVLTHAQQRVDCVPARVEDFVVLGVARVPGNVPLGGLQRF